MAIESRKCNITFLGPDTVKLTNMFFTKTYYLTQNCTIDLHSLKKLSDTEDMPKDAPFPLFVYFYYSRQDKCYFGVVGMKESKDKVKIFYDANEMVNYKNNNKNYSANVWVDE